VTSPTGDHTHLEPLLEVAKHHAITGCRLVVPQLSEPGDEGAGADPGHRELGQAPPQLVLVQLQPLEPGEANEGFFLAPSAVDQRATEIEET
jgi:hypothetical protein